MASIDLNADLGESFGAWTLGDDESMMAIVTSANVACGFHAGDPSTMRRTCEAAVASGVSIGAQVSYPDLVGFGRRRIEMDPVELRDAVVHQIGALAAFARLAGGVVAYVKPHGALYHVATTDEATAEAIVDATARIDPSFLVLGAPDSALLAAAEAASLRTVGEAFADRAYRADGRLVARTEDRAVLDDPATIASRVVRLVGEGIVTAVDGTDVAVHAESVCVHGDTPGAVEIARAVRAQLEAHGHTITSFAARH